MTEDSDNYLYNTKKVDKISEEVMSEYKIAYEELATFDDQPQYIKDYILEKARKTMNKAKKKLAAPKAKKGAKKKTTYLYGGPAK
jgi:hypothetical protein